MNAAPYGFIRGGALGWDEKRHCKYPMKKMILGQANLMQLRDLLNSYRNSARFDRKKDDSFRRSVVRTIVIGIASRICGMEGSLGSILRIMPSGWTHFAFPKGNEHQ